MEVTCKAEEFMEQNSRHAQRLYYFTSNIPYLAFRFSMVRHKLLKLVEGEMNQKFWLIPFLWFCINLYLSHHDIHHLGPARTLKSSMTGLLLQPGSHCQAYIHLHSCLPSAWNIWVSLLLQLELSQPFTTCHKIFPSWRASVPAFPDHC